jgi:hypothetical protein
MSCPVLLWYSCQVHTGLSRPGNINVCVLNFEVMWSKHLLLELLDVMHFPRPPMFSPNCLISTSLRALSLCWWELLSPPERYKMGGFKQFLSPFLSYPWLLLTIYQSFFKHPMTHFFFFINVWQDERGWQLEGAPSQRVMWARISRVWSISRVSSRRRAQSPWCSEHFQVCCLYNSLQRWVTGICRKEASDGTQSCQEVVQKARRTSNIEQ